MKLSLYNVLSSLIQGILLLYIIINTPCARTIDLTSYNDEISFLAFVAASFMMGYLINAIGSWSYKIIYWSYGGIPSDKILDGSKFMSIKLIHKKVIKDELIKVETKKTNRKVEEIKNEDLFSIAKSLTSDSQRIQDLNGMFAFTRSCIILLVFSTIITCLSFKGWLLSGGIGLVSIVLVWIRSKQYAYYYVREVYSEYAKRYIFKAEKDNFTN